MSITIDDFQTGQLLPPDLTLYTGSILTHQVGTGIIHSPNAAEGTRILSVLVQENPHNQPLHLDIATGFLNLSVGVRARLRAEIVYGLHGFAGATTESLGLSLASFDRFRVNLETSDENCDFPVVIQAHAEDGRYSEGAAQAPRGPNPTTLDLMFKVFQGAVDLRADIISRIVWIMETTCRAAIRSIEVV